MSQKTIILKPGETFILPKGATVDAVVIDGAISVTSTCNNLPAPSSYKCGHFDFICDQDDNPGHSMDENHTGYEKLNVGGNTYIMNKTVLYGDNPGTLVTVDELNTFVPDQTLFTFTAINRNTLSSGSKRQYIRLFFKAPDAVWDSISLWINNWETSSLYFPTEEACGSYPSP